MQIIKGKVIRGEKIGEKQGYPTANLSSRVLDKKRLTKGVYFVKAEVGKRQFQALLIVGVPGFRIQPKGKVEIYFLDFRGRLYGKVVRVVIYKRLRRLVFYKDRGKLLVRIRKDIKLARQYFKNRD